MCFTTTIKNTTQATPVFLGLQGETVLPLEIQLRSKRVAVHEAITIKEKANLRSVELEALDETRSQLSKIWNFIAT